MAREFPDGAGAGIGFSGWAGTRYFGALSIFAVVKQTTLASNGKIAGIITNASQYLLGTVSSNGTLEWWDTVNGRTSTTKLVANEWFVAAFTKAAGTVTGRFHFYRYSTGVWTHENASGTSVDFSGTAGGLNGYTAGADTNFGQNLSCVLDALAFYQVNLTDAEVEMARLSQDAMLARGPSNAYRFDQPGITVPVPDLTRSGFNQNDIDGTILADASPFPYGPPVPTTISGPQPIRAS